MPTIDASEDSRIVHGNAETEPSVAVHPAGDSFVSFFVRANSGDRANPTDVYAAVVTPPEEGAG